jgi:ribosomal protein S18 acetylase RimI-like enzyme
MLPNPNLSQTTTSQTRPQQLMVPADQFTFQALTDIYNETRMDYLVPMPMSESKLREYIHTYDVDLAQSVVAMSKKGALGLGLLGIRGHKTWITRLGVTPRGRGKGVGRQLMTALLDNSRTLQGTKVILEVIKNNEPAHQLFKSLGFRPLRELLVIRRPPQPIEMAMNEEPYLKRVGHEETLALLPTRTDAASWVTATESMHNTKNLAAVVADLPGLGRGWIAYQNTTFQLTRLVLSTEPDASPQVATTLLQALHHLHPLQDTIIENLAADNRHWPIFQALGYLISFVRIEMDLDFDLNLCRCPS